MKEKRNLHLKVQELCDCYATTDPLVEMSKVEADQDVQEASAKWLALAALHGINAGAHKITVRRKKDGTVDVSATYHEGQLPSPGKVVGEQIFEAIREITHIEGENGKITLALGVRDSSIDLAVKLKSDGDSRKLTLKFPDR